MRRLSSCAINAQQVRDAALVIVRNQGILQVITVKKEYGACHRSQSRYFASSHSKEGMRRLS